MKQFLIYALQKVLAVFFSLTSVFTWIPGGAREVEPTLYALDHAVVPIWTTQTVINETVSFKNKTDVASLLYTPTKIISVYDYYLKKQYIRGVDFIIEGKELRLTENTSIPYWGDEYYSEEQQGEFGLKTAEGYILYSETEPAHYQLCVTYEHEDSWSGFFAEGSEHLGRTLEKMSKGEALQIVALGDSITRGCGASATNLSLDERYSDMISPAPPYIDMVLQFLQQEYREEYASSRKEISLLNQAVIGSAVGSAVEQIEELTVIPDLVILAFGMNQGGDTAEEFQEKTEQAILALREKNPSCEIMLVSTMLPNLECEGWVGVIPKQEEKLNELAEEYGAAVVPMTSISRSLYENGKRPVDLLSNHINHPNDFLHAVYAQAVLTTLLGEGYTEYEPVANTTRK